MTEGNSFLDEFKNSGALLEGHFLLSSGLHSPQYLQCAIALQDTVSALRYGRAIAAKFDAAGFDSIASPAIGGIVIGFATAAAFGSRFIWTERENSVMTLRRGFEVQRGERVLVVEDVITTGGSTRECIEVLTQRGANIIGAASIVDRSNGKATVGVPLISLISLEVPAFDPEDCPLCAAGVDAIKPGSRQTISA